MNFITAVDHLPEKIKSCVMDNYSPAEQRHLFSFKTSYKPNPTIPLLWYIQLTDRIALCNTHKTRGLYKEIANDSINSIRLSPSALIIEIIFKDLNEGDFRLTVERAFDFRGLKEKLTAIGFEVIGCR